MATYQVNTIAEMKAITGYTVGQTVNVGGYWINNDGGGGTFTYTSSSAEANGGTVFVPGDEPADIRLIRDISAFNYINALWFGLVEESNEGGSITNANNHIIVLTAVSAALAEKNGRLYIPPGVYQLADRLRITEVHNGLRLFGELATHTVAWPVYNPLADGRLRRSDITWSSQTNFRVVDESNSSILKLRDGTTAARRLLQIGHDGTTDSGSPTGYLLINDITIEALAFNMNRENAQSDTGEGVFIYPGGTQSLRLANVEDVLFKDIATYGARRSAITNYGGAGVRFENLLTYHNGHHGLADAGHIMVDGLEAHNCGFDEDNPPVGGTVSAGGGFMGVDYSTYSGVLKNFHIHHCWIGCKNSVDSTINSWEDGIIEYNYYHGYQQTAASTLTLHHDNVISRYNGGLGFNITQGVARSATLIQAVDNGKLPQSAFVSTAYSPSENVSCSSFDVGVVKSHDYAGESSYSSSIHYNTEAAYFESLNTSKAVRTFSAGTENYIYSGKFNHTSGNALHMLGGGATTLLMLHTESNQNIRVESGHTLKYGSLTLTGGAVVSSAGTATEITPTLTAPSLSSPAHEATGQSLTPTLSWGAVSGAEKYVVQISADNFTNIVWAKVAETTSVEVDEGFLEYSTVYEWRVYAVKTSSTENFSNWSTERQFTTMADPGAVSEPLVSTLAVITKDYDSATLRGELTDLGGEASVDCFFRYRQIGQSWEETTKQSLSATGIFTQNVTGLLPDTTHEYYAVVEWGTEEKVGSTLSFTTDAEDDPTPPPGEEAQRLLPDSVTSGDADWNVSGAANIIEAIGALQQSDGSYIYTAILNSPLRVKIRREDNNDATMPSVKAGWKGNVRVKSTAGYDLMVRLFQGSTLIKEWRLDNLTELFTTKETALTELEADSITDVNDLYREYEFVEALP